MTERGIHDLSSREIERSAELLIAEYGADANTLAKMRVKEMSILERRDAARAWAQILEAVQRIRPPESKGP